MSPKPIIISKVEPRMRRPPSSRVRNDEGKCLERMMSNLETRAIKLCLELCKFFTMKNWTSRLNLHYTINKMIEV